MSMAYVLEGKATKRENCGVKLKYFSYVHTYMYVCLLSAVHITSGYTTLMLSSFSQIGYVHRLQGSCAFTLYDCVVNIF